MFWRSIHRMTGYGTAACGGEAVIRRDMALGQYQSRALTSPISFVVAGYKLSGGSARPTTFFLRYARHWLILPAYGPVPMRCAKCVLENRAGRKFCSSCGTALPLFCDTCGFLNEVGEKYCGGCGRALSVVGNAELPPKATTDREGDRRPVTVFFCDLVGYTKLTPVMDAEDIHALLERFFALVDTIVDRFGGIDDAALGCNGHDRPSHDLMGAHG